jgi:hypothetical protein
MNVIYERRADESEGWYERLRLWLFMGSTWSLAQVHEYASALAEGMLEEDAEERLPTDFGSWQQAAERYGWRERVLAYEQAMRERALAEANRAEPEELRMVATLLQQVNQALQRAALFDLSRDEARAFLPTLRLFFRDLFRLHRDALQAVAASSDVAAGERMAMSADELMEALNKIGGLHQLLADLRQVTDAPLSEATWQPLRDLLAQLYPDEASARRIADQAQLDGTRIHFAARALDRWHALLTEASHAGYMEKVIAVALAEYPNNRDLVDVVIRYRRAVEEKAFGQPKKPRQPRGRRRAPASKKPVPKKPAQKEQAP